MLNSLLSPIYLDENLVKILSSVLMDGYIESLGMRFNIEGTLSENRENKFKAQGQESRNINKSHQINETIKREEKKDKGNAVKKPKVDTKMDKKLENTVNGKLLESCYCSTSYSNCEKLCSYKAMDSNGNVTIIQPYLPGDNKDGEDGKKGNDKNKNQLETVYVEAKEKTKENIITDTMGNNMSDTITGRGLKEFSYNKIYVNFHFHNQVINKLYSNNMVKYFYNNDSFQNINCGDILEIDGDITNLSVVGYITNLMEIFSNCGIDKLDNILNTKSPGLLNYTTIYNMLSCIKNNLLKYNTDDIVIETSSCKFILPMNLNCINDYCSIYDQINCSCKILGKVCKTVQEGESISLLRKCMNSDYYNSFFQSLQPYLDILAENSIIIPNNFNLSIEGPAMQILPISILM